MEEGFPGNLHVQVRYSWNNQNELHIEYEAETDAPTHINLTNHTYFNLNGCLTDVRSHEVIIHADAYTEVDSLAIPTGRLLPVDNTWLDFRKGRLIGEQIDRAKPYGYDHNLLINNFDGTLRPAARASDQTTGIVLETETTEPGMQFYTANHLDSSLSRGETKFSKRMGFCFETQHYPDSPNRPEFPSTLLKPGEKYHSQTIYRFSNLID
jgi:aldose 1-epimerase